MKPPTKGLTTLLTGALARSPGNAFAELSALTPHRSPGFSLADVALPPGKVKPPTKSFATLLGGALALNPGNSGNALADLTALTSERSPGFSLADVAPPPGRSPGNYLADLCALPPGPVKPPTKSLPTLLTGALALNPGNARLSALMGALNPGNALKGEMMTSDQYLNQIITKYLINAEGAKALVNAIYPTIQRWANEFLIEAIYSGSMAKGTAISLASDADVFISLSSNTQEPLAEIYTTLFNAFSQAGYQVRKQNVSIAVSSGGYKIDLVPGKRQSQYGYEHSLYKYKAKTWTKTNVKTHVTHVKKSNRINEIKLTKIWRELNKLDFPSFYLELAVIDCLSGRSYSDISGNFWEVLGFLAADFVNRRYLDPANTNNVISDDLSISERRLIQSAAQIARTKKLWSQIVW